MESFSPPQKVVADLLVAVWLPQALFTVTELKIPELLAGGERSVAELATETGAVARSLHRVMRALAAYGIFAEARPGVFAQTASSDCLREDAAGSLRPAVSWTAELPWMLLADMLSCVRTGTAAAERRLGKPVFAWLAEHPEPSKRAHDFAAMLTAGELPAVLGGYDFSRFGRIVDVGGGRGALALAIARKYPDSAVVLFEAPNVIAQAREAVTRSGGAARLELISGDIFDAIPAGADAYLLMHVVHDWPEDDAVRILRNIRDAMGPETKLLVIEHLVAPGAPSEVQMIDMGLLCIFGGEERTEDEYRRLFARAGFGAVRVVRTSSSLALIEATRTSA